MKSLGAVGAAWVAGLPKLIEALQRDWAVTIGRPLPGGSASYVARATRADGSPAVVKISLPLDPDDQFDRQVAVLQRAEGRGYVRLLAVDRARRALLLEGLGPALTASRLPPEQQLAILADTLADAWLPADGARPHGEDDKAASLHRLIRESWPRLGRSWPAPVFEQALRYAEGLIGADPAELVVVHGDPHPGNALRVPGDPERGASDYRFVDPDGFVADRAYDLGVALRDWCGRLNGPEPRSTLERYCAVLAEHSGADPERIWRWGYVERVSTGLYVLNFGADRVGRPFLDTAARMLD